MSLKLTSKYFLVIIEYLGVWKTGFLIFIDFFAGWDAQFLRLIYFFRRSATSHFNGWVSAIPFFLQEYYEFYRILGSLKLFYFAVAIFLAFKKENMLSFHNQSDCQEKK